MSLLSIKNKIGIPSDWKMVPIGKVLISSQYGTSNGNSETGVPVVGMKNLQDGKVDFNDLPFVSVSNEEKESLLLHDGDILLNRTNSYDLVGKIGFVDKAVEAVFASYLVRLQVDRAKSDPKFVALWLTSFWADQMIKKIATRAVSQANVNPTEFKKFCLVPVLPQPEQKAIADLLSTWDEAIDKTERLIRAKEKRFQLQLSEIISFIEEDNSAEFVELGKILSYEQPTKYIVESSDYVEYGKTPVLTANKSFILGHVNDKEGIYTELPVIIFDDFTTDSKFVDFSFKVKSSALKILKPASNVDAFLVYWLITRINTPVGGHKRHWISEYQFNEILLPKLSQQKKFSIILEYAQREINLLKQLADKYKTQKRGLMQKMLTGEWRVKPEIVNQYMEA
jgi:type I restriction enzyme S subunit